MWQILGKYYLKNCFQLELIGFLYYRFHWAHIWSCPPSEGDDYIFHCKPAEQKIPKHKRLIEWYRNLLEKAAAEKVIAGFNVCSLIKLYLLYKSVLIHLT